MPTKTGPKSSLRDELLARAKLGEITPEEAETEAALAECGPLEVPPYPIDLDQISNHPDLDPTGERTWTLLMTLAWIITRDPIAVRAVWVKSRRACTYWAAFPLSEAHGTESNHRTGWELRPFGPPTVSDVNAICEIDEDEFDFLLPPIITTGARAREELWNRLSSGQLSAEGKRHGTSERVNILSSDWLHLNWLQDPSASANMVGNRAENIALYDDLCVSGQDVREIWKPLEKLYCEQFEREDWTVEQALPWIAYGEPTVLHFVGRSNLRAERQRSLTQCLDPNPGLSLLQALKKGKLLAVRCCKEIAPEYWFGNRLPRRQPEQKRIYFRRSDILREWPEREERLSQRPEKPLTEADLTNATSECGANFNKTDAEGDAHPPRTARKRGRKDTKLQRVIAAMKADISHGESVCDMLEKAMAEKYRASRDTCRRARDKLYESKTEFRQIATKDK